MYIYVYTALPGLGIEPTPFPLAAGISYHSAKFAIMIFECLESLNALFPKKGLGEPVVGHQPLGR